MLKLSNSCDEIMKQYDGDSSDDAEEDVKGQIELKVKRLTFCLFLPFVYWIIELFRQFGFFCLHFNDKIEKFNFKLKVRVSS